MISRSNWLPLKSIMVAAPVDCSRSAYALSARYQSLRQNLAESTRKLVEGYFTFKSLGAARIREKHWLWSNSPELYYDSTRTATARIRRRDLPGGSRIISVVLLVVL